MISNRSVPTDTVLPHILYRDVEAAAVWLANAFSFVEYYRYGQPTSGIQMRAGNAWIQLKQASHADPTPAQLGLGTQSLTIFIEDIEQHYERAQSAGVTLVEPLHETVYGELQYAALDLDGHHWLFSRHARDLSPDAWGATVANTTLLASKVAPMLAVSDANAAIDFYRAAFDADLLWSLGDDHIVAGLAIHGAPIYLATESPEFGARGPSAAGFTTVRIELFADDPEAVQRQALAAGATLRSPVQAHTHPTIGPRPIHRMLQGSVLDPFGHIWLIGKFLD